MVISLWERSKWQRGLLQDNIFTLNKLSIFSQLLLGSFIFFLHVFCRIFTMYNISPKLYPSNILISKWTIYYSQFLPFHPFSNSPKIFIIISATQLCFLKHLVLIEKGGVIHGKPVVVRALWLVNLAGRTLLYGPLKFKIGLVTEFGRRCMFIKIITPSNFDQI